ncbi:helix-turn-helix domain-containing protein [Basilea psittacipulmonis]
MQHRHLSQESGLKHEGLYQSFSSIIQSRFKTILKIIRALKI